MAVSGYEPGALVLYKNRPHTVVKVIGVDAHLLLDDNSKQFQMADPQDVIFPSVTGPGAVKPAPDLAKVDDEAWKEARRRRDFVAELAVMPHRSGQDVAAAANELGVTARQMYNLLRRYQVGGGEVTAFLPIRSQTRRKRLSPHVERIIHGCIGTSYLKREAFSLKELTDQVGVTAQVPPELASEHTHQRAQVPQRIGK